MERLVRAIAACLLLVAPCHAARADEAADVATKWGLIGTWRLSCAGPASHDNPILRVEMRNGKMFEDRDFGDVHQTAEVKSATIRPDSALVLVLDVPALGQTRETIEIRYGPGKRRTQSDRDMRTNQHVILNGRFVASEDLTPAIQLCPD